MRGWDSAAWLSLHDKFSRSSGTQPRSVTKLLRSRSALLRASERRRETTARKFADSVAAAYTARWQFDRLPDEAMAQKQAVAAVLRYLATNARALDLFTLIYNQATPEEWAEYERREAISSGRRYKRVHDLKHRLKELVDPHWDP